MTADKATLRMNALVTYLIKDARRAVVGAQEFDGFLTGKDDVAQELEQHVRERASALGLEVFSVE